MDRQAQENPLVGAILAKDLGYLYFDTGVMYRAVTLGVLQSNISLLDEEGNNQTGGKGQNRYHVNHPKMTDVSMMFFWMVKM